MLNEKWNMKEMKFTTEKIEDMWCIMVNAIQNLFIDHHGLINSLGFVDLFSHQFQVSTIRFTCLLREIPEWQDFQKSLVRNKYLECTTIPKAF